MTKTTSRDAACSVIEAWVSAADGRSGQLRCIQGPDHVFWRAELFGKELETAQALHRVPLTAAHRAIEEAVKRGL